jgi:hypothetical protein
MWGQSVEAFRRFLGKGGDDRAIILRALPPGGVGVEIGVWKGEFSQRILKTAKPSVLHLVDPWLASDEDDRKGQAWYGADRITQEGMDGLHDRVTAKFSRETAAGRVRIHRGTSRDVLATLDEQSVDFVYVDGDHSYAGVVADLIAALRVTRQGGLIICDDYLLGQWWGDGVVRAVHEFLGWAPVIVESKVDSQMVMRKISRP